jgi:uncharacterized membrane-anchored protein
MKWMSIAAAAAMLCCAPAFAQEGSQTAEQFVETLQFRSGNVNVEAASAVFALDSNFKYLEQRDARRVLEEFWGNPPDETVLGLVVPTDVSLAEEASWAVVVTASEEGYVSDVEASAIDYDALLKEMQASTAEENDLRRDEGYPTVDLVGWAAPPRYDAAAKKLYWAQELAFEGDDSHTVNYEVRVLGRRGYLSLNAVASREDLPAVAAGMQRLIPQVNFVAGERYADFNSSTDQVAAYGLAALVGGTLAAKAGLFGKLFAALLAAKKIVIPLAIGAVALVARLFKRKSSTSV